MDIAEITLQAILPFFLINFFETLLFLLLKILVLLLNCQAQTQPDRSSAEGFIPRWERSIDPSTLQDSMG